MQKHPYACIMAGKKLSAFFEKRTSDTQGKKEAHEDRDVHNWGELRTTFSVEVPITEVR